MKFYDPHGSTTHHIKVTFQIENYKGSVVYAMGGNCRGRQLINESHCFLLIRKWIENDVLDTSKLDEYNVVSLTLTNEEGKVNVFVVDADTVDDYVVAIEIIDYTEYVTRGGCELWTC